MPETQVQSLGWEDPLEKEMVTHSSILAWKIPRTEEPSGLQCMESQSQTRLSDWTECSNSLPICSIAIHTLKMRSKYCFLVAKLYLTLCDPMNCSLPCSSVHGILLARVLEWIAISSSKISSWFMTLAFPALAGIFFTTSTTWEAPVFIYYLIMYRLVNIELSNL